MKTLLSLLLLAVWINIHAQIAINTDGSVPDNSAMLDVKTTSRGILIPRMSQTQRNAIVSPANGLMVFQTDNSPGLYCNSGTPALPAWVLVGSNAGQWQNSGSSIYYNLGFVGIGIATPDARLSVENTSLGGISTTGSFQVGQSSTYNLVCDNNEVQARYNGGANTLFLQYWGGDINACTSGGTSRFYGPVAMLSDLSVSGRIGVKSTPSYDLHVNSTDYSAEYIFSPYDGGTVTNIIAGGTSSGTWGLYAYATTLGYAAYFSGDIYCSGSYLPSDVKLKDNIQPMKSSLEKIMQLDVVTYNYKTSGFPEMNLPTNTQSGFTAQNLEHFFPELVKFNPSKKEQPVAFKAVNYIGMIPVLTKAIQEQQVMIEELKIENTQLIRRIEKLESK